jgi:hypothetical protein
VILGCRWQLRMGPTGPVGLDFGAVMALAAARGAPADLIADVLPEIETTLLIALKRSGEDGDD